MATTVEITLGDDGKLTVGIAEEPSADLDDSQQVANVEQALAMAKHLLANPPADTDEASEQGGADDDSAPDADAAGAAQPAAGGDAGAAQPAAGGDAGAGGGGGGDAQAMWDQLAQQQGPAH
jgi:hypothetical protein